jgi:hypothetical protein
MAGGVKAQRASESVDDGLGGAGVLALLEAGVVVDADPGQLRYLLPAEAANATSRGARIQPHRRRGHVGPAPSQELAQLRRSTHDVQCRSRSVACAEAAERRVGRHGVPRYDAAG